jgi:hypothetical protein
MPSPTELPIRDVDPWTLPKLTRVRLTTGAMIYAVGFVHLIAVTYRVLF